MTSVHHLVELQALRTPAAVAVVFRGLQISYRELNSRADVLAAYLCATGIGPNVLVGLCLHRSIEMVVGILGILKAGGAYVPIDPNYPSDRIEYVLRDAGAKALVTERALISSLPEVGPPRVLVDEPYPVDGRLQPAKTASSDLAYVIYTSGSTGRPKGVQIEHRSVINFLESMRVEPGMTSDDVVLALTTLSFDIAALEIFLPLISGARVVIGSWETAIDPKAISAELQSHGATVFQATPTTWQMLLDSGWSGDPKLKALCGGEPMSRELAHRLLPRCAELWNMYGPTETTVWSTCKRIERSTQITIGRPIKNTEILILDSHLRAVAPGQEGELFIGGDGLARGYHNRPDLTDEKFIPHPFKPGHRIYRTGDLAKCAPSGEIICLGRLDLQIKIRGFRIELGEIESVLASHSHIEQVVVSATRSPDGNEPRLAAYFTARATSEPSPAELREHARRLLPEYMVPVTYIRLAQLPLTPNGKIDRSALPSPLPIHLAPGRHYAPPESPTEKKLATIWRKVLGLESVGRDSSFFDLGGSSILAAKVFSRIEAEFDRHLPLAVLFKAQTIATLAELIDSGEASRAFTSLVPIQPKGTKPILYCVHGAGGNILLYHALIRQLGENYPVFGLHSRGLDGRTAPFETIEDMAAQYVQEVQQLQPRGPYCLAGYCMGGTIAFEMAQALRQKGERVELLALLDTYNFGVTTPTSPLWDLLQRVGFHARNFFQLSPQLMKSYLREKRRVAGDGELAQLFRRSTERRHGSAASTGHARLRTIQATNDRAAELYVPKPYEGRLTIMKPQVNYAKYPDPLLGWQELALSEIDVVELPINPHAMLVDPSVKYLAAALRNRLDAVESLAEVPRSNLVTKPSPVT